MWSIAFKEELNCRCLRTNCCEKMFGCKKNKGNEKYIFKIGDCNELCEEVAVLAVEL